MVTGQGKPGTKPLLECVRLAKQEDNPALGQLFEIIAEEVAQITKHLLI